MRRNYQYGRSSCAHIGSTEPVVQELCNRAITIANKRKLTCPDFGISAGFRTSEQQYELYNDDLSQCDGYEIKSAHQSGLAIDFFAVGDDGNADYSPAAMALVATCFFEAATDMGVNIEWGGNFGTMSDTPHIEVLI